MEKTKRRWHSEVIQLHKNNLYQNLIYEHNVTSEVLKEIEFDNCEPIRGFFAVKDKQKYWIDEEIYQLLPIRIKKEDTQELKYKEDVVIRSLSPIPFKITPKHKIEFRQLIDDFLPFDHSRQEHWTLQKLVAIASFVGRTYICIATKPSFGKSSVFSMINCITDKSPVFKPRSVPGVLNQINGNGNMVFDEVHDCKKETKEIMEEFSLQIGGGASTYINGALKTSKTKTKYSCSLQSITYLYNNVECYKAPEKTYFEMIFSNNKALDDRFLKMKFEGKLSEKFDREFNIVDESERAKMYYIEFAKELLYLQELKQNNKYVRKWKNPVKLLDKLKGRKKIVFDEITWCIDMYCNTQEEYENYFTMLENCVINYGYMIAPLHEAELQEINIEEIKDTT